MSNISLKQLEVFVAIVEYGSFTEAGRRLYLAQSTVSSHISALEETLQVDLFRRESKKHVELTADGKRVYQYAKDVVAKCEALESSMSGDTQRELIIGASTVPSKTLLPEYILRFAEAHPSCCCVVKNGDSEQVQRMLLGGDIQVGFVGSSDSRQLITYERVAEDALVLITPNNDRFAELKRSGAKGHELLLEPMIFRDQGSGTQKMIDNYLSNRDIDAKKMSVRYYLSDPELIQDMVALGVGVSILSEMSARERVRSGELLTFELEDMPVSRNIYMAYRKKGTLSELAKDFVAMVRKAVK